jgi:hypothetical protein
MIMMDQPKQIDEDYLNNLVKHTLDEQSLSPVIFVENKLGLAYWVLPKLYAHANIKFRALRKQQRTTAK